jgi:hypothetical protein
MEYALVELEDVLDAHIALCQVDVVGDIALERACLEEVVDVGREQLALLLILDHHVNLKYLEIKYKY